MKDGKQKYIWGLVFVLFLAVVITVSVYISNVKNMAPTENAEVIALVPEESGETENVEGNDGSNEDQNGNQEAKNEQAVAGNSVTKKGSSNTISKKNAQTVIGTAGVRLEEEIVGSLEPEMTVQDEKRTWTTRTEVDIFRTEYEGTEASGTSEEITVQNAMEVDRMKLIAPGTENEYVFWVKNTGQTDIVYRVWFEEHGQEGFMLPLEVRVKHGNKYVLGTEDSWLPIAELNTFAHEGSLREKNYAQYTLEWRWPFEREDDVADTYLGDTAVNQVIQQEIIIHTYGEGDPVSIYETVEYPYGDIIYELFGVNSPKTGDSSKAVLWTALVIGSLLLVIVIIMKKRKEEYQEENSETEDGQSEDRES